MAELVKNVPGATPATIEMINEVVRGVSIKQIRPQKALDEESGGEAVCIDLQGGDKLIFIAVPAPPLQLDGPTARIQPLLITRMKSKLVIPG